MNKQIPSNEFNSGQEKETHLLDYFNVFRRRWKVAFLVFLLILAVASGYILTRVPVYVASTILTVMSKPADKLISTPFLDNGLDLRSDIRLIHSRSMAEKVVRSLNLHWQVNEVSKGFDLNIQELEISEKLSKVVIEMTSTTAFKVRDEAGRLLGTGSADELFSSDDVTLRIAVLTAKPGDRMILERKPMAEALAQVKGHINAFVVEQGSNVVQIDVEHTSPVLARDIANTVANTFKEQSVLEKTREATLMLNFLDTQLADLKGQVERSEKELQSFKIKSGLKNLSLEGERAVDQVVALERENAELVLKRKRIEIFLNRAGPGTRYFTSVEDVPGVAEAQVASLELTAKREDLLESFTEAHPEVVAIDEQLDQITERVIRSCKLEIRRTNERIAALQSRLAEGDKSLGEVPQEQLELARMTRTNSVNSELYMTLLQRQQQTQLARATTTSNIEIIDPAIQPNQPVRPNRPKLYLMSILISLMAGIGCTFLLDYFDQTIRDIEDVREYLGLPVLATIPRIDLADQSADLPSKQLALTMAPKSPAVEAFRSLRTALHFATTQQKGKVVMVTSSIPSEGKSTISGNLAGVLAQSGSKVLLIGCDLRRPSLSEMFHQETAPGLTELLVERNMKALRHAGIANLDFIPAGAVPPNPSELLGSKSMSNLLKQLRDRYDYIVLDAPPVLPVTDAQVLVNKADMVAVVVEACRVQQKAAQRMVQTLQAFDAKIIGVILNDKTGTAAKYYGSYNYYGHKKYGGYYGESTPDAKPGALKKLWERLNA